MGKETESRTEREIWIEDGLLGRPDHYKTTITNPDGTKDEGRGNTQKEAEKNAGDKHGKRK